MKKIVLEIVGLRYHDYKNRLPDLYAQAMGAEIVLQVEEENEGEANAVAAYLGSCCVGMVKSSQRGLALAALHGSGEDELIAVVVGVNQEYNHLYVELMVSEDLMPETTTEPNVLSNWCYDGPKLLPCRPEAGNLKVCVSMLQKLLCVGPERWTDKMEDYLCGIEKLLVHDISSEMDTACLKLDEMLTALSARDDSFVRPLLRLQFAVRELASQDQREAMAQAIRELSDSKQMDNLLVRLGDEAEAVAAQLPKALLCEMHADLGMLMTHLRYWRQPRTKVQQVRCLLALTIRLERDARHSEPIITDALADWANGDEQKTMIVEQFAKDCLLKSAPPDVQKKLTRLKASCKKRKEPQPVTYNIEKVDTLAPNANTVTNNHNEPDNRQ